MFIRFYLQPVEVGNGPDGLPLYKDVEFITINRDSTHTVSREVEDDDRRTFRELYEVFKAAHQDQEKLEGFPIDQWAVLKPSEVQNLKMRGVLTIQQLAARVKDENPMMVELAKKAKSFIAMNSGNKAVEQIEKLTAEIELLKEDLKAAQMEAAKLREKAKETQT